MSAFVNLISRFDDKGLKQADRGLSTTGQKFKNFGKVSAAAFATAAAAAVVFAGKLAVDGIKAASDFNETLAKTGVIFGKNSKDIEKWASTASSSFGQSQTQAMDAAATFATFGKSAGLKGKDLTGFSKKLTVLSSDFASFNNTSPEEAITAIGAALRGESEPIRKYGVLLNDATLKAEAMKLGIYSGTGTLSNSAKVQAAYSAILAQSTDAQGDFARTSDGLANTQRTLTAKWDDAQVKIGQGLLPVVTKLAGFLADNVLPAVEKLGKKVSKFLTPFMTELGDYLVNKLIPKLVDFAKVVAEQLVPILKRVGVFIRDTVVPAVQYLAEWIMDYLYPALASFLIPIIDAVIGIFETVTKKLEENKEKLQPLVSLFEWLSGVLRDYVMPWLGKLVGWLGGKLGTALGWVIDALGWVVDLFGNKIPNAIKTVFGWFGSIKDKIAEKVKPVADVIFKPFKTAFNWIAEKWNNTIGKIKFTIPDWVPGIGGNEFAMPQIPMLAKGGIVTKPTLAMIGEAGAEAVIPLNKKNSMGGINITVNGALDPEAVARQIQRLLARSEARAGAF